jgi:hypothetical protein
MAAKQPFELGNLSYGSLQGSEKDRASVVQLSFLGFEERAQEILTHLPKSSASGQPLSANHICLWNAYLPQMVSEENFKFYRDTIPQEITDAFVDAKMANVYQKFEIWMSVDTQNPCSMLVGFSDHECYVIGRWGRTGFPFLNFAQVTAMVRMRARMLLAISEEAAKMSLLEFWFKEWFGKSRGAQIASSFCYVLFIFVMPLVLERSGERLLSDQGVVLWRLTATGLVVLFNYLTVRDTRQRYRDDNDRWSAVMKACEANKL